MTLVNIAAAQIGRNRARSIEFKVDRVGEKKIDLD